MVSSFNVNLHIWNAYYYFCQTFLTNKLIVSNFQWLNNEIEENKLFNVKQKTFLPICFHLFFYFYFSFSQIVI